MSLLAVLLFGYLVWFSFCQRDLLLPILIISFCCLQLDEDESQSLTAICRHLHLIPEANDVMNLTITFSLASLIANVDVDKFYTYKGENIVGYNKFRIKYEKACMRVRFVFRSFKDIQVILNGVKNAALIYQKITNTIEFMYGIWKVISLFNI